MFRQFLMCLLLVSFVSGQAAQPAPPAPAPPNGAPTAPAEPGKAPESQAPEVKVGPDDPALTIKGFCADATLAGDACKTVLTRGQFEKLAEALQPGMSPAMRRQLATAYARMLAMSSAAEKRGLDKTPHFDEAMRFARMQILSQELSKTLQAESNNVNDQDIQDSYQKNAANFEQATFVRIFVPHAKRIETPPATPKTNASKAGSSSEASKTATTAPKAAAKTLSPEEQQKAGEEAMKKEAALLHARLVKGEDPEKLEKEAFTAGGLPGNPPPTKMEKVRRTSLPAAHQAAMDLKVGEVSEVISDPSGNYIYKVVSKEALPLDTVKTEIRNQISAQRYREAMQGFQNNADLNEAYFGPTRAPGMPVMPHGRKPPAQSRDKDDDPD
jgi:parvulin-like peptidyl-prolyl isomerase